MIVRLALVLAVAVAGVFGAWAMAGIAAAMWISGVLTLIPWKARS